MVMAAHCLQLALQLPHPHRSGLPSLPAGMAHSSHIMTRLLHLPWGPGTSLRSSCRHKHSMDRPRLAVWARCLSLQLEGAGLFNFVAAVCVQLSHTRS